VFVNAVGGALSRGCFEVCPAINPLVTCSCISSVNILHIILNILHLKSNMHA
jgi:hypothetical protein